VSGTWLEQRNDQLAEEVQHLKRELKAARKLSRSRLERLQKAKPEKQAPTAEIIPWAEAAE
jgi:hypothetical protein